MKPLERKTTNPDYLVRPYEPRDREALRTLCCETGFLGNPIDSVFSDRQLFADYLTSYYTDWEPDSCWVGEANHQIIGYLTACKRWNLNKAWSAFIVLKLLGRVLIQWLSGKYDAKDKKFIKWILAKGWRENPMTPKCAAHFHFNAKKEFRRKTVMRDLIVTMLEELKKSGVPQVYGQMVTYKSKRSDQLFEYFGWKVVDKKRITKYQDLLDQELYLTTIIKDLNENSKSI